VRVHVRHTELDHSIRRYSHGKPTAAVPHHPPPPTLRITIQVRGGTLLPRLAFFTTRAVGEGEELCWDYGGGGPAVRTDTRKHEHTHTCHGRSDDMRCVAVADGGGHLQGP
jgi:hypothetical protein